jgi:hypothetical protein
MLTARVSNLDNGINYNREYPRKKLNTRVAVTGFDVKTRTTNDGNLHTLIMRCKEMRSSSGELRIGLQSWLTGTNFH